ncbi:zinc finger protein 709 isoform X1 [Folsomia candida]|uniref:zinc finger protein 709 isoform X1 n=1 Tax=Folsomia candida TaxID=158441 RepID=UPI0016052F61|nr:zinc finger protein 709 isoform X1 [Folsomia candida]
MQLNLPFVQLTRNNVLDNVAVSECKTVKISGCFLCGIKPLADFRSLPENVTRQEKAALFRDLLINPTISKNTSPSSYNQFMSTTESCSDCLSLIKEVCALRQEIVSLEKELENRLEESRRKYLNGCEIVANSLTVGRIKLHAVGQDPSSTLTKLSIPAREFSPRQMSPDVEDDESIGPEEDMSSEFDEEEEYTPPNGKPTGRTMQSKNEHSTNATINPSANTKSLICSNCGITFSCRDTVRRHKGRQLCINTRKRKNNEGLFSCSKCCQLFRTRRRKITHEMHICNVVYTQEQVAPWTLYTCPLCDKQFVALYDYQRHYGTHSEVKKSVGNSQCEILGGRIKLNEVGQYNSSTSAGLSTPARKLSPEQISPEIEDHKSIDPDEEEDMSSEFEEEGEDKPPKGKPTGRTLQANNEHSNSSTINPSANTESLICSNCGMTFSCVTSIRRHKRRQVCTRTIKRKNHGGPFSCSKCFQLFPTWRFKIIHEMHICNVVYTQEQVEPLKLYTCFLCNKQFVAFYDYQCHYRNHSEVKESVVLDQLPRRHRDNHTPERNLSFVAGKSVDSVRQHQDKLLDEEEEDMSTEFDEEEEDKPQEFTPKPLRKVRPITEKEISPYEPLLGGKLTIHHCSYCTRWFVKEDNLRMHLTTDHGFDTDSDEVMHIRKLKKAKFCANVIKNTEDKTTRKRKRPAITEYNPNADFSIKLVENFRAK